MRLVLWPVRKSKVGLIAVKKVVSKPGKKPFVQTFYIKPDTVATPDAAPKAVVTDIGKPSAISNSPGGKFRIVVTNPGAKSTAEEVPRDAILGTFKKFGIDFVILKTPDLHNKVWTMGVQVVEASTGMLVHKSTPYAIKVDSVASAQMEAEGRLDSLGYEKVTSTVASSNKTSQYATAGKMVNWPVDRVPTVKDYIKYGKELLDWTEPDRRSSIDADSVGLWLKNIYLKGGVFAIEQVLDDIRAYDSENAYEILRDAVYQSSTYENQMYKNNIVDEVLDVVMPDDPVAFVKTFLKWAEIKYPEFNNKLIEHHVDVGYEFYMDKSEMNELGITLKDLIIYAIDDNMFPSETVEYFKSMLEESQANDTIDSYSDVQVTDHSGTVWNADELAALGEWTHGGIHGGGVVRRVRDRIKEVDDSRRRGKDEPISDDVARTLDRMMAPYWGSGKLFRGSSNSEWANVKVGDAAPIGIASFSTSEPTAKSFGKYLIVLDTSDSIPGIDVCDLCDSSSGVSREAIDAFNVSRYYREAEVVVRVPSIEVVRIEDNTLDVGNDGRYIIYVKPVEMELLNMMKSMLSGNKLSRAIEATFNIPLHMHDDPEGRK